MLSKSTEYALKAVLCLSVNSDEKNKMSPKTIAHKIDIPESYLASLLKLLSKKGLISSSKGRGGGFYLTEKDANAPLINIIDCIDGLERIEGCLMGLPTCTSENPCPIHHIYQPFKTKFLNELSSKSIKAFALDVKAGNTNLF